LLSDDIAVVADTEKHANSRLSSISFTTVIFSDNNFPKHQLWSQDLIGVEAPLIQAAVTYSICRQVENSETCGICCLLNIFGRIQCLGITQKIIMKHMRKAQRSKDRSNVPISSVLGSFHEGFIPIVFDTKDKLVHFRRMDIKFSELRGWDDVIYHTINKDVHVLMVFGKHQIDEKLLSHVIGIDLIHGLTFDSDEEVGACTVLNVNYLQVSMLPYIQTVMGFTFKGEALIQFNL
jgi:hypothetical protein